MLVACSGGPDSQVLLHILHALREVHGCGLMAAGVDHGLRPEAAAELKLAERLATALGLPFVGLRVQLTPGASLQGQARAARYAALLACAAEHTATCVAVGHTLDDQAETVLVRILRGSGVAGLGAIVPRRPDGVIRPLLDARREDVHAYAAHHALPVARDPSNADPRYLRVRVRQQLLPLLCAENAQLPHQLAALADDARASAALISERVEQALVRVGPRIALLQEEPALVRRLAIKALVERKVGAKLARTHLIALDQMLSHGGQVRVPGDVVVSIADTGELSLTPVTKRGRGLLRPSE